MGVTLKLRNGKISVYTRIRHLFSEGISPLTTVSATYLQVHFQFHTSLAWSSDSGGGWMWMNSVGKDGDMPGRTDVRPMLRGTLFRSILKRELNVVSLLF